MKPKYDMVCVKELQWRSAVQVGYRCRILDFKSDDDVLGEIVAVEFERHINGHNAPTFPGAKGKDGHCIYFDSEDMNHLKFI